MTIRENMIPDGNDETSCAQYRRARSFGGAGIVADIKTIAALGCFPAAALTSITFQNTTVCLALSISLRNTARAGRADRSGFNGAAAKTGMLPTAEIVAEVARLFAEENLPAPVVDPVVVRRQATC
jgi:hydroxymethylpyrimidine/phosphomethylpyrimidine kinase